MIRAHASAIKARLEEDPVLVGSTFQGVVLTRPNRYCTLFIDGGIREMGRFTGPHSDATFSVTIHSVGTTVEQAQLVEERVIAQLLDYTPTVAGRRCRRIRQVASRPIDLDQDVSPPLYFAVDVFELTSSPA